MSEFYVIAFRADPNAHLAARYIRLGTNAQRPRAQGPLTLADTTTSSLVRRFDTEEEAQQLIDKRGIDWEGKDAKYGWHHEIIRVAPLGG